MLKVDYLLACLIKKAKPEATNQKIPTRVLSKTKTSIKPARAKTAEIVMALSKLTNQAPNVITRQTRPINGLLEWNKITVAPANIPPNPSPIISDKPIPLDMLNSSQNWEEPRGFNLFGSIIKTIILHYQRFFHVLRFGQSLHKMR